LADTQFEVRHRPHVVWTSSLIKKVKRVDNVVSPYPGARYVEIDIILVSAITCKNMFRHPQICIVRSVSLWDMMIGIVGLIISCMKGQDIYTRFKVKYIKKETPRNIPLGEETAILVVDLEEEDEEEDWVKLKER
jgi:hypothetical protein